MVKSKLLTKTEFYDVYGISLLLNKGIDADLLCILTNIAKKYSALTERAVRKEIKHFNGTDMNNALCAAQKRANASFLKELGIYKLNRKLTLQQIYTIFNEGNWSECYGGKLWAIITKQLIKLNTLLLKPNLNKLIVQIDHMNDLAHNNELYLVDYCTFTYLYHLDFKKEATPEQIFDCCSTKVYNLSKKIEHQNKSDVARFHAKG